MKTNTKISRMVLTVILILILCNCIKETPLVKPTLVASAITNITATSAIAGGEVTSDGGSEIIARGVCWSSTNNSPSISDNNTIDGTGLGIYSSSITGLSSNTTYYIRAYATNSAGTSYYSQSPFKTLAAPVITTTVPSSITVNSFTSGGNVTNDGGSLVTARGICWSVNQNPTLKDNITTDGTGTGIFIRSITGLTTGVTYYIRAYATNSVGTSFGDQVSSTPDYPNCGTIADLDGNIYKTVTIGSQCWMRDNLRTTKYNDGTSIPNVTDNFTWANLTTPGYCWFNNDAPTYKNTYGAMYNWYTVNTNKLCPTGWHVPSDVEWATLITYLGGENVAGGKLKEQGTVHWNSPNTGATNEVGFSALPYGYRYFKDGVCYNVGVNGYYWTITSSNTSEAWDRYFYFGFTKAERWSMDKRYGFSVRCLKD